MFYLKMFEKLKKQCRDELFLNQKKQLEIGEFKQYQQKCFKEKYLLKNDYSERVLRDCHIVFLYLIK